MSQQPKITYRLMFYTDDPEGDQEFLADMVLLRTRHKVRSCVRCVRGDRVQVLVEVEE